MRDSPISTHSRELRASKLEFSNSFMAAQRGHVEHELNKDIVTYFESPGLLLQ